jgi:hypothetical protein
MFYSYHSSAICSDEQLVIAAQLKLIRKNSLDSSDLN